MQDGSQYSSKYKSEKKIKMIITYQQIILRITKEF